MEIPGGKQNKARVCIAEIIGTFILSVAVNYGVASGGSAPALAQFADCLLIGPISNAHINPAVTVAVLIVQGFTRENIIFTVMIWLSQIIGAIIGVLWVRFTAVVMANELDQIEILSPIAVIAPNGAYIADDGTVHYGYLLVIEIFATFMFVSCCLSMANNASTEKPLNAITVSMALYLSIQLAGNMSGGSLNPAVGFIQSLFQHQFENTKLDESVNTTYMCLTMVMGPLIGGILAAPVHLYLTDSKRALESSNVKSMLKVNDHEVAMTERKLTQQQSVRQNIQEGMPAEVNHGFTNLEENN